MRPNIGALPETNHLPFNRRRASNLQWLAGVAIAALQTRIASALSNV
jgi:hypothetical protein